LVRQFIADARLDPGYFFVTGANKQGIPALHQHGSESSGLPSSTTMFFGTTPKKSSAIKEVSSIGDDSSSKSPKVVLCILVTTTHVAADAFVRPAGFEESTVFGHWSRRVKSLITIRFPELCSIGRTNASVPTPSLQLFVPEIFHHVEELRARACARNAVSLVRIHHQPKLFPGVNQSIGHLNRILEMDVVIVVPCTSSNEPCRLLAALTSNRHRPRRVSFAGHVALRVSRIVIAPIRYRSYGDPRLEAIGMCQSVERH